MHPLPVLQRVESVTILQQFRPDLATNEGVLDALAHELGDLPLALDLAGRYLRTMRHLIPPDAYLTQICAPDLLQHLSLRRGHGAVGTSPTHYEHGIAKAFAMSYSQLDARNPCDRYARQVLACVATCAPEEILPREVVYAILDTLSEMLTPDTKEAALQRLEELGLLYQEMHTGVRLHHLLARVVQAQEGSAGPTLLGLPGMDQLYRLGRRLIQEERSPTRKVEEALVTLAEQYLDQGRVAHLMTLRPQLQHVASTLLAGDARDRRFTQRCIRLAHSCRLVEDYTTVQVLYERVLAIDEQVSGVEHTDTAWSLTNLAGVHPAQKNYAEAQALYERALAIAEQVFGMDHPDTALMLSGLGETLSRQGDYLAARPLHACAVTIATAALGPEYPDTMLFQERLAACCQAQERPVVGDA